MEPTPAETLYGSEPKPPVAKPPSLMDQVAGVFTEPAALFQKLAERPSWGPAFSLTLAATVAMSVVWALRVDGEAFARTMLEANPKMTPERIDAAAPMIARFLPVSTPVNVVIFSFLSLLLVGFLFWLAGKASAEAAPPSFKHAVSAFAVPGLVGVPKALLLIIICLVRQIGPARLDQLSPTAPGFYLVPESAKLHAFLCALDLFTLASVVLTYLAARHLMRLKAGGAVVCAALMAALAVGMPVLFAR